MAAVLGSEAQRVAIKSILRIMFTPSVKTLCRSDAADNNSTSI
jgi:hypothetical protein